MSDASNTDHPRRMLCGRFPVHPIGIGCWAIGGPDHNLGMPTGWSTADDLAAREGLELAFHLGANLFDTADIYGHGHSERLIGHLVRQVPRRDLVLSGKVGYFAGTAAHAYSPSHMRRQLEATLENLCTDHLDLYAFHNENFGTDDRFLEAAIEQMQAFRREGLIKAIGMRGPHRFATERMTTAKGRRAEKRSRFLQLLTRIKPDYVALRFNAFTPVPRVADTPLFAYLAERGVDVLATKPLAQGLLTGKYRAQSPPRFASGDHRLRKAWFTPQALERIDRGLEPLRDRFGRHPDQLARVALRYCLQQGPNVVALVGFTRAEQVRENLGAVHLDLSAPEMAFIDSTVETIRRELDARSEFFVDELS